MNHLFEKINHLAAEKESFGARQCIICLTKMNHLVEEDESSEGKTLILLIKIRESSAWNPSNLLDESV